MYILKKEKGTGMIEVLVALLLLAIGVLGFTVLQLRAVDATNEALNRVQAMNIARDFAERIRINPYALTVLKTDNTAIQTNTDISAYLSAINNNKDSEDLYVWSSCYQDSSCNSSQLATQDVQQVVYRAFLQGMKVNLIPCKSSSTSTEKDADGVEQTTTTESNIANQRMCIYVAWDKTIPNDGTEENSCAQYGIYKDNSKCVILEAY
ncbi:type IV pilus modification protein PilV [Acinetobacter sp. Marseille-Q1618]|uniref:type IV pilus modification protein PilV n=1 Tax=Acinetobacter sp. Marseille-Q1618 TaxID=2697502 RepID=UPI001570C3DE|nr:type IV pilus modification protein PilV [Acinetobacter sp. Marseille-Q1618]